MNRNPVPGTMTTPHARMWSGELRRHRLGSP